MTTTLGVPAVAGLVLADTVANAQLRTVVEFARLRQFSQWWHWMLLVTVCLAIVVYVVGLYRRDTRTVPKGIRWGLSLLRLAALVGLLVFFLDLEKRNERQILRPSRVAALVDTSQSMGLVDVAAGAAESRLQQIVNEFASGTILAELLEKHDVVVYRFDAQNHPEEVAAFSRQSSSDSPAGTDQESAAAQAWGEARVLYRVAIGALCLAGLCLLLHAVAGRWFRGREDEAYLVLTATVLGIVALVIAAVGNLRHPDLPVTTVLAQAEPTSTGPSDASGETSDQAAEVSASPAEFGWAKALTPRGVETRLGEAIRAVMEREVNQPLAGILILTDGCHNAGLSPESIVSLANSREVQLYPIGFGSERMPRQVRLVDLEVPPRVYPGDRFTVTGYVQADGLTGRPVRVVLQQTTLDDRPLEPPVVLDRQLTLGADREIVPVPFEVLPDQPGRYKWVLQVEAPSGDDLDTRDNRKTGTVQVVERRNRVLLLAGGPMREYRFLRNLLFRDPTTQVDVFLQTAAPGAAQEANQVLLEFPTAREELFEYDAVVAFDPDWTELPLDSLRLLDEWVAEKGGGLILVAGPVYTPAWTRGQSSGSDDEKVRLVKDLYPVTFYRSGAATIQLGRAGSSQAWPLKFTDEGLRASFLWLEDSPTASEATWSQFEGVYGYQALRSLKPGAQVYARFSDPQASTADEQPVYMAGQFYGTGRTFYLGSGEMWRLNSLGTSYFERFYTKLIRYVSQGRLLRDSARGILLVDKEQGQLGDTITVRASLSDAQYQPLELKQVTAQVTREDGTSETMELKRLANAERPGMYSGQFTTTREGTYRIDLALPDSDDELLTREVKVRLPSREIEQSQRNDALLSSLAKQTNGQYFVGLPTPETRGQTAELVGQLAVKDQVTFLPGTPDNRFEEQLMSWLLAIVAGALCCEWLLRRLYRLA